MGRLDGKIAFITGAASGIGSACALRFAEEGATLIGFDLRDTPDAAWTEAVACAPAASFSTGDVASEQDVAGAVQVAIDRFGASAPGPVVLEHLGFTPENVARRAEALLAG